MRWLPAAQELIALNGRLSLQTTAAPDPEEPLGKLDLAPIVEPGPDSRQLVWSHGKRIKQLHARGGEMPDVARDQN